MQEEVDGVTLLAGFEVLAFVNVEEGHLFEELPVGGKGNLLDAGELYALVHQESEVAAHGGELADFSEVDAVLLGLLHQERPVDVGEIDFRADVEGGGEGCLHQSELEHNRSVVVNQSQRLGKDVVRACLLLEFADGCAEAREDMAHVGFKFVNARRFFGVRPRCFYALARQPKAEMQVFGIGGEGIGSLLLLGGIGVFIIAVAKLEEAEVGVLAVGIVGNAFQAAEEERLTQHVEVAAQRIEQLNCAVFRVGREVVVVSLFRERIVEDFAEALADELLRHEVLQLIAAVHLALDCKARLDGRGDFHIIISIDAQDIFHHVAGTLHVHAVGGHGEADAALGLGSDFHVERSDDFLDDFYGNGFADEVVRIFIFEIHGKVLRQARSLNVFDVHAHGAACQFFNHKGSHFEGVDLQVGVDAALKAEGGIGIKAVAASALAYPRGVEVGAFEQHVFRGFVGARALAAEHAGDTHGGVGIANGEVAVGEFVLYAVEGYEGRAFGHRLHYHLLAFYHIGVEAVERLAVGKHHVVRHVDHVINRPHADGAEFRLQPLGAFLHLAALNRYAAIARTGFGVFYNDVDVEVVVVGGKR